MSDPIVGQPTTLSISVYDSTGTLADATAVTLTIQLPDLTTVGPFTPTHGGTGAYTYTYTWTTDGRHVAHWVATGTNAGIAEEDYNVLPAYAGAGIVSLTDAKAELNISDTDSDDELLGFIRAATAVVEDIVGPVVAAEYTEWFDGGDAVIAPLHHPILSVTSVTEYNGTAVYPLTEVTTPADATGNYNFFHDASTGELLRLAAGWPFVYFRGLRNVKVVYTAGRASVPTAVRLAALELVRHMWESQQGVVPTFGESIERSKEFIERNPATYLIPDRVAELLRPYRRAPGVG